MRRPVLVAAVALSAALSNGCVVEQPHPRASASGTAQPPQSVPESETARSVRAAINGVRRQHGRSALAAATYLQSRAEGAAASLLQTWKADPGASPTPPQLRDNELRVAAPHAASMTWRALSGDDQDQVAGRLVQWASALADMTHIAIGVSHSSWEDGVEIYVMVAIALRQLPPISATLIDRGRRQFAFTCHICGYRFLGDTSQPAARNVGGLTVVCPHCHRLFDVFAIDRNGRHHRPTWFLRGYQPRPAESATDAWLQVLTRCRYVSDRRRFRRPDVWQLAAETYGFRAGDCEDTSILLADWLAASGYDARVAIGVAGGGGHAWVVLRTSTTTYLLESTGGRRAYRRMPPRAEFATDYSPEAQFDRQTVWFRTDERWTSDYDSPELWSAGPWPSSSPSVVSSSGGRR